MDHGSPLRQDAGMSAPHTHRCHAGRQGDALVETAALTSVKACVTSLPAICSALMPVGRGPEGATQRRSPAMLMRFDPYRELDRLTEQLASSASRAPRAFPMDAYRRGDRFIVEFDLPGVEPAAID